MRRALGPLLLTTLLTCGLATGCGDDGSGVAADSNPGDHSSSGGPTGDGSVEFTTIAVIGQSAAGGRVDPHATVLDDDAAVAAFTRQFRTDATRQRIETAISKADVPSDRSVVGAVVSLGCDVPRGVSVHASGSGLTITPTPVASPKQECLVAVTTIALVSVPSEAV